MLTSSRHGKRTLWPGKPVRHMRGTDTPQLFTYNRSPSPARRQPSASEQQSKHNIEKTSMAADPGADTSIMRLPREIRDQIWDSAVADDDRIFLNIKLTGQKTKPRVYSYTRNALCRTSVQVRREYLEAVRRRIKSIMGRGDSKGLTMGNPGMGNDSFNRRIQVQASRMRRIQGDLVQHIYGMSFCSRLQHAVVLGKGVGIPNFRDESHDGMIVRFEVDRKLVLDRQALMGCPKSVDKLQAALAAEVISDPVKATDWKGSLGYLVLWKRYVERYVLMDAEQLRVCGISVVVEKV